MACAVTSSIGSTNGVVELQSSVLENSFCSARGRSHSGASARRRKRDSIEATFVVANMQLGVTEDAAQSVSVSFFPQHTPKP